MKKRLLSLALVLAMFLCIVPATVLTSFAVETYPVYVIGVGMNDGDYLASGATSTQTTKPSSGNGYAYYEDGILTLHNFKYTGNTGYMDDLIYSDTNLNILLEGTSALTNTDEAGNCALYAEERIVIRGEGKLNARAYLPILANEVYIEKSTVNVDGYQHGIYAYNGDIYIYNSDVYIDSGNVGLYTVSEASEIAIERSEVYIDAKAYAIFAEGDFYMDYSNVELNSTDINYSALQCNGDLSIADGINGWASTVSGGDSYLKFDPKNLESYQWIAIGISSKTDRSVTVAGVTMYQGDYLPVNATKTQEDMPSGGYAYFDGYYLILDNYTYEGKGYIYDTKNYGISSDYSLNIILAGRNSITISDDSDNGVCTGIVSDRSLLISGNGTLNVTSDISLGAANGGIYIENTTVNTVGTGDYYNIVTNEKNIHIIDSTVTVNGGSGGLRCRGENANAYITGSHVTIKVDSIAFNSGNDMKGSLFVQDSYFNSCGSINGGFYCFDNLTVSASTNRNGTNAVTYNPANLSSYQWIEATRKVISYIDVVDIDVPETTFHPDFEGNLDSPYTIIEDIDWYEIDDDGDLMADVLHYQRFEEGKKYRVYITVRAADGYEFDDINTTAYIGPKQASNASVQMGNQKLRTVWTDYTATGNPENLTLSIGNITLNDGDYLANDATGTTTTKPSTGYAYYKNGVLYLNEYKNFTKEVRYKEGLLEVNVTGDCSIGSFVDDYDNNSDKTYSLKFTGDGSLSIAGYGEGWDGSITATGGEVIFDGPDVEIGDNAYCFEGVEYICVYQGEIYAYTAQSGAFAMNDDTWIYVYGGSLELFDAGCFSDFIPEDIYVQAGNVYVGDNRDFSSATLWDEETPLTTYESILVTPKFIDRFDAEVEAPEIGKNPSFEATTATEHCNVFVDYWFDGDFKILDEDAVFEACVQYAVGIDFYVEDGYTASNNAKFYINGIEAEWSHVGDNRYYAYIIFEPLEEEPEYILGDINGDSEVTLNDYTMAKRAVMGTYVLDETQALAADINGDGEVTLNDYTILKRAVMGTYVIG